MPLDNALSSEARWDHDFNIGSAALAACGTRGSVSPVVARRCFMCNMKHPRAVTCIPVAPRAHQDITLHSIGIDQRQST